MSDQRPAVAIDAMSGDEGVAVCVQGVLDYFNTVRDPIRVVLVGDETLIREELDNLATKRDRRDLVEIVHAPDVVDMNHPASHGIKKKDSSIAVAVRLQKEGRAQATISPGHTGAYVAAALLTLGRLQNVSRPAIATSFPTESGATLILDVGANPTCKARNLYEFAIMGSLYSTKVTGNATPRVALLSIGEERSKGNDLTLETYELLDRSALNFVGNIEGRDILRGRADVIVCDGFIGNIMLKFAESVKTFVTNAFKRQIRRNKFSQMGAFLMGPFLRRLRNQFDYAEVGGAPFLGVDGNCIVCHGRSSARAIYSAIHLAKNMIDSEVNTHISTALTNGSKVAAVQT